MVCAQYAALPGFCFLSMSGCMRVPAPPPRRDNTCAVVVTYHPEKRIERLQEVLYRNYGGVVLVDNTPKPPAMLRQGEGVEVILNRENKGQAAALNQGFRIALEKGFHWVATFDQDSLPYDKHLQGICRAFVAHPRKDKIAVIGCNYAAGEGETRKVGMPELEKAPVPYLSVPTVITAGSVVNAAAYRALGGFREDFFIDHVDHEWCLRARAKGLEIVLSPEILLEHGIGAVSYHRLLGKRLEASNHSPTRRYFWVRNLVFLARSYIFTDTRYILSLFMYHVPCSIASIALFESEKLRKVGEMARGLMDGLRGYTKRKI